MSSSSIDKILDGFPKQRPPLPKEVEEIFSMHYKSNREGQTTASSMAQRMESWMHKKVARDLADSKHSAIRTLELGAGTLNQLQYEPVSEAYDIVEPFSDLYKNSARLDRVRNVYADIAEVPDECRYDRITSIAALEHICNLPEVVARSGLLLADGGVFRAGVPSEGTLLWAIGWKLTTGLEFRCRYGIDYGQIMRHEHVNTAREIEHVLRYFFGKLRCSVFGLSRSISLYRYYECSDPRKERCRGRL